MINPGRFRVFKEGTCQNRIWCSCATSCSLQFPTSPTLGHRFYLEALTPISKLAISLHLFKVTIFMLLCTCMRICVNVSMFLKMNI